jgi:hypothetical protein
MKTASLLHPMTKCLLKKIRQQAQLRQLKTPNVLAQQAVLNAVLMGRKAGVHQGLPNRRAQLKAALIAQARIDLAS